MIILNCLVGDTCNIFEMTALESLLGAEMTLHGHSIKVIGDGMIR